MPQSAGSLTTRPVPWPFRRSDVFARITDNESRLAVIHSLPGMLVWPILMVGLAYAFQIAVIIAWSQLGGDALQINFSTTSFAALVMGYACFALILWERLKRHGVHHSAFSVLPVSLGEVAAGLAVLAFMIIIGGRITLMLHEYAMADPSLTLSGGASREDLSNIDEFAQSGAALWAVILLTLVAAPLVEEILCRGWMLPMMMARGVPALFAIVISAAAFGLLHITQGLMVMISTFILGLALGLARVMTGRVAAPVIGHVANNAWAVFAVPALLEHAGG